MSCGEPLSLFAQVMIRHDGSDQPYKLQQVRSQAPVLKKHEARESEKRMEVLQAIDQRRQAAEAEAKEAQEAYLRKVSRIVLLVIPIFIVFIILFVVLIR
jgi:CHASE3 domain sensor protein